MHLPPGLQAVQAALDQGNAPLARDLVARLDPGDRRILVELMGAEPVDRLYRSVRRGTRTVKRGRVVVLPGITGSELAAEYADGKSRLLWLDFISLVLGRSIRLMALGDSGEPADPSVRIVPRGFVLGWYINLVTSLQNEWDVLPVSYDWRLDIDRSADALAERITAWARGEPVHIVAHSMGGLVSRRMIQRHPELWAAMDDGGRRERGGRLVMLGTPNRGSYAIPLTLTGEEFMIKLLDVADLTKGRRNVLARLNSFPGSYQMLPSPVVRTEVGGGPDDHLRLFDLQAWGDVPVRAGLLARAHRFATELHGVVDAARMIYVAGYGEGTPSAIRIRAPGKFEYQRTTMGDGRVPHALGLLPGVPAYYVEEAHGDLPKNEQILAGLTELLTTGSTGRLETSPRLVRAVGRRAGEVLAEPPGRWHDPHEFVDQEAVEEFRLLVRRQQLVPEAAPAVRRSGAGTGLPPEDVVQAERMLADAAGMPAGETDMANSKSKRRARPATEGPAGRAARRREGAVASLAVEVVWGDITQTASDVCAVGHYNGVEPQNAELAIDWSLVTGLKGPPRRGDERLVLTRLTRRGLIPGTLGHISFFPPAPAIARKEHLPRTVAVAGMGYPGAFSRGGLRQLAAQLADAVSTLPEADTLSAVLIGSGEGTLSVTEALIGMIEGLDQWARTNVAAAVPLRRLRIVERDLGKARDILARLLRLVERGELVPTALRLDLNAELVTGEGGRVDEAYAAALHLAVGLPRPLPAAARAALRASGVPDLAPRVEKTLQGMRRRLGTETDEEASDGTPPLLRRADQLWGQISVVRDEKPESVRLSFVRSETGVRVAAITDRATVSERAVAVDFTLVREQIALMQTEDDPRADDVKRVGRLLRRLLLPREFRELLQSDRLILDVDRAMAAVPWEVMQCDPGISGAEASAGCPEAPEDPLHVGLVMRVARQLRTTLSPAPHPDVEPSGQFDVLVIADPDDTLEFARAEGHTIAALLGELGCCVQLLAGSRGGEGAEPATRSSVIDLLASRRRPLDLLHYAGHGDFIPASPGKAGWFFADGVLGPDELRLALGTMAPAMVVSNSCLTGLLSETRLGAARASGTWDELGLIPAFADVFLQQGVRHFIAANRPIYDDGAVEFATTFYQRLLGTSAEAGDAVRVARLRLHGQQDRFGPLWAAYHHYGDPTARVERER